MTAPDPRLGEIEGRLAEIEVDGAKAAMWRTADVAYLLAELRARDEALAKVDALTREWEAIGKGNTQFDAALRVCAYKARAAVAAATGGGDD